MNNSQEIQMMSKWRARALAFALCVGAPAVALAQNAIQSINSTQQAGSEVVRPSHCPRQADRSRCGVGPGS